MAYPRQGPVLARLERETRIEGRRWEEECVEALVWAWRSAKGLVRSTILAEYRRRHGSDTWSLATAGSVLDAIGEISGHILSDFRDLGFKMVSSSIRNAYTEEVMRKMWMLDQVTPASRRPKTPRHRVVETDRPDQYYATWKQAMSEWLFAYHSGLLTNLRLVALHEGGAGDAADEADATKVGGFNPEYKLASMLTNQYLLAQRLGRKDVADANGDLISEEVFQTMEDASVCPDCDSQDGVQVDRIKIEGHVYGFNCRCFERVVPESFASLLRDGTAEEKEAALLADARGLVPDSMVIYDPDTHDIKAHEVVTFGEWEKGMAVEGYAR